MRCTYCGEPDLETERQEPCCCHINPPCSSCEQAPFVCRFCGEHHDYDTDTTGYSWVARLAEVQQTIRDFNKLRDRAIKEGIESTVYSVNRNLEHWREIEKHLEITNKACKPKRRSSMKSKSELRKIVAMVSDEIVTVGCKFAKANNSKVYLFMALREDAEKWERDDLVACHTNKNGYSTVYVAYVDEKCNLDIDFEYDYDWAFQKVDTKKYDSLEERLAQMTEKLNTAQLQATQENVLKAMGVEKSDLGTFLIENKS